MDLFFFVATVHFNFAGEEFAKLMETGKGFLQELSIYSAGKPDFRLACWTPDGVQALQRFGATSFIDGTFNIFSNRMTLTLLMVRINEGPGHVCAWLAHQHKTTDVYR